MVYWDGERGICGVRRLSLLAALTAVAFLACNASGRDEPTPGVPLSPDLTALAGNGAGGLDAETVRRILNAPNPFPDMAATVNGQPISGTGLARRVEVLRMNYEDAPGGVPDQEILVTEALDALIADELLIQAARERGVWPTQEEVVAQAQRMKEAVLQFPPGSAEREAAETLWEEQGVTVDEIDSNPTVLEGLARALAIARIKSDVGGRPAPGYPIDMTAYKAAIKDFTDSLRDGAEIQVYVRG